MYLYYHKITQENVNRKLVKRIYYAVTCSFYSFDFPGLFYYNPSMLNYSDIEARKYIVLNGEPFEVLSADIIKKQQQKPVNRTKLQNLITGKVLERSFHNSDSVEEADIDEQKAKFIYSRGDTAVFCDPEDKSNRYDISRDLLEGKEAFIKEGDVLELLVFDEQIIDVKIPIKVDLTVTMAPEAEKGNTSQGANKDVELETGMTISVPLFIKEGDVLRINTETGKYTERI